MVGIGNYVSIGAAEHQAIDPTWSPSGSRATGGGASAGGTIASLFQTVLGPGGLPGVITAARGGGGAGAPAPGATSGGGGFNVGKLVPFALLGAAVIGGFFLIKKLRKKA